MADERVIQTPVWQLAGIFGGNEPGLLTLSGGRIRFETDDGVKLECPVSQLQNVRWPWYSFNAALNFTANGEKYRLTFARPNGAAATVRPISAAKGVFDLGGAVKTGKAWRAELVKRGVST